MKVKMYTKRTLSLILCVVMLMTCWVFTSPGAGAATNTDPCYRLETGDANPFYHVEMDVYIYDAGNGYNRNFLGTRVGNPDGGAMIWLSRHYKDMGGIILWYKDNNGTGTEYSKTADFCGNYTTTVYRKSTNAAVNNDSMFPTSSSNDRDIWDDGYYTLCWDLSGFPTSFMAYNDNDNNGTYTDWEIRQLRVYPYDSSVSIPAATNNRYSDDKATTLFSGAVRTKSSNGNPCHYIVYQYGHAEVWQDNGFGNEYDSNSNCAEYNYVWNDAFSSGQDAVKKNNTPNDDYAVPWDMPHPQLADYNYIKLSDNNEYFDAPEHAVLTEPYVFGKDQYGAQLAGTVTSSFVFLGEKYFDGKEWQSISFGDPSYAFDNQTAEITPLIANGYRYHQFEVRPQTEWVIDGQYVNMNGAVNGMYYGNTKTVLMDYRPKTVTYTYKTTTTLASPVETDTENHIYDSMSEAGTATAGTASAFCGDTIIDAAPLGNYSYYDADGHYAGTPFTVPAAAMTADMNVDCIYRAPKAHNWGQWQEIPNDSITENMSGDTYHRQICNAVKGETHYRYQPHTWDEGRDNPAASCTEAGNITYTCTDCGKTRDVASSAAGHTAGTAVIENELAANCESVGGYDTVSYCRVCNAELSRTHTSIPATGHNTAGVAWQSDGTNHWKVCQNANCPHPIQEQSGHTLSGGGTVIKEETCVAPGTIEGTCSVCSRHVQKVIPIDTAKHAWVRYGEEDLDDLTPHVEENNPYVPVIFVCENGCGNYCAASYNEENHKYTPNTSYISTTLTDITAHTESIPTLKYNTYFYDFGGEKYNYAERKASLRINLSERNEPTQAMRFSGNLELGALKEQGRIQFNIDPAKIVNDDAEHTRMSLAEIKANKHAFPDNTVIDFGFVFTQARFITTEEGCTVLDYEKMLLDHESNQIYRMSVVYNNKDNGTFSRNWKGVTDVDENQYTFNLVIDINQNNYQAVYCARTYAIYKYRGDIVVLYDKPTEVEDMETYEHTMCYSHDSVLNQANKNLEDVGVSAEAKDYLTDKIIDFKGPFIYQDWDTPYTVKEELPQS